jgi:hypothetical protein
LIPERHSQNRVRGASSPGRSSWKSGIIRAWWVTQEERMAANIQQSTDGSSLAEVIDRILDRGAVIDAFVRVTLVGIELLAIEARIVIESVDTWLKYAEAVRLTTTFDQVSEISS